MAGEKRDVNWKAKKESVKMKKTLSFICMLTVLFSLSACNKAGERQTDESSAQQIYSDQIADTSDDTSAVSESNAATDSNNSRISDKSTESNSAPQPETSFTEEETNMLKIEIIVGEKTFNATLYDNETAKALINMLPMTLDMSELNGNEKYYYLESSLPTNSSRPSEIKAGDIMLYGSDCLVLFYESFSTPYSYTPLGYIDDPTGLAEALGSGSVQVAFRK